MQNNIDWLSKLDGFVAKSIYIQDTREKWLPRLIEWNRIGRDERESDLLLQMNQILDEL